MSYFAELLVMDALNAQVDDSDDIGAYAVELAVRGWPVFPLSGKSPFARCGRCVDRSDRDHPRPLHDTGQCVHTPADRVCHGLLDASNDPALVGHWWSRMYRGANIGIRLPEALFVLDVDPRAGGHQHLAELEQQHGKLPDTLRVWSGRGDGGVHHYLTHPGATISATKLGDGLDVKTSRGYVLAPPSTHPATGKPYRWDRAPIAAPPSWLVRLLRPDEPPKAARRRVRQLRLPRHGPSIADTYSETAAWRDILEPHGWVCVGGDGDTDGSAWRHPAATARSSATIRNGCLFVYSTNTPFTPTEASTPHGYTKFRAFATLEHHGDLSAAARALQQEASAA